IICGLLAGFGLLQVVTGQAWVDRLAIPGLEQNGIIQGTHIREGFLRPNATAVHPLEFGSVVAMALPLALARALGWLSLGRRPGAVARWWPAAALVAVSMVSISRSTMINLALAVLLLIPALTWLQRRLVLVSAAAVSVVAYVTVPGLSGSIVGLFTGVSQDPGISSRLDGYAVAVGYTGSSPVFGRGVGTFLPGYRIFDNQYLQLLVETGILGTLALLGLVATTLVVCYRLARYSPEPIWRQPAVALASSSVVGAASLAMFDGFSFPMMPSLWFLIMGMAGAAYRLVEPPPNVRADTAATSAG
ncbi:MAG: O-antigen ligase family protein, partial [Arachnia sp.]